MHTFIRFIGRVLGGLLRLVLGLLAVAVALAVLLVALALLLIGVLWALLRGRSLSPWGQRAPVFVGRVFRHTTGRVWRTGDPARGGASGAAVEDVEAREVSEGPAQPASGSSDSDESPRLR